ncbi:MFS transporter, partial [Pseudomonas aeruginosa]|nr:MFS transporter [Pseudomonas aeruginosa]
MPDRPRPPLLLVLALLALPQVAETILSPALPALASHWRLDDATSQWTMALFFVGFAPGIWLWGWLADRLGRRPALLGGLGLDVETLLEAERARYLHGEILTEGERLRFADDLERRTGLLVTLAFSLKESLFKALYPLVGKRFYFEHAELLEWRADGQARLRLLTDLSPEWRHGSELDAQFA